MMSELRKGLYWGTVFTFGLVTVYPLLVGTYQEYAILAWMLTYVFLYYLIGVRLPKILSFKQKKETVMAARWTFVLMISITLVITQLS